MGCISSRALCLFVFGVQIHFAHNINPTALFEVCLDAGRHCRIRLARHRLGLCCHSLGLGLALRLGFRRNSRLLEARNRLLDPRIACMVVSHVFGMQGHPTQGGPWASDLFGMQGTQEGPGIARGGQVTRLG